MTTTEKSSRTQVLVLLLAGLIAQPVTAGVIPGRWEKVSALEIASPITAELKNGDRIRGQFRRLSPSALEFQSRSGRAMIPKSDIRTITTPSKDGLGNGAGIGAAIGAGLALGAFSLAVRTRGGLDGDTWPFLMFGGIGAGIGAGIGTAADAATKGEPVVLYKAPGTP